MITVTNVFILCSGQEDNIGDVVLRRELLSRLNGIGRLHVFLGAASTEFIAGLELRPGDVVYSDKKSWRRELWRSIRRGDAWLVDKPGELLLDRRHLLAQVRLAVAALATRARGGTVLRVGLGQRTRSGWLVRLFRPLLRNSTILAWRDTESQRTFRIGEVMPDWGFGEAGAAASPGRRRLVLSYRSDRPELSDGTIAAIARVAAQHDLEPIVVTQVGRDAPRSHALADRLGCAVLDWPSGRTHVEQEKLLREVYTSTALVLSDRLHVLIVALTEGAVPLGLTEHQEAKIGRHFEAIGLADVSVRVDADSDATATIIERALDRSSESAAALAGAHEAIRAITARIATRPHTPPTDRG